MSMAQRQDGVWVESPISEWFELSYAQYLTVPRLVMESMPLEWQQKMAALLQEMDETFDWRPKEGCYWVRLKDRNGRFTDAPLGDYRRGSIEHLRKGGGVSEEEYQRHLDQLQNFPCVPVPILAPNDTETAGPSSKSPAGPE